jgi:hypothetical protein
MLASDAVPSRRTTVSAETDDLAVLEAAARKRGVSLARVLGEAVEREADRLRRTAAPRFGIVHGDGTASRTIAGDEHAPARRHVQS